MIRASRFLLLLLAVLCSPITYLVAAGSAQLGLIREKVGAGQLSGADLNSIQGFIDEQLELMMFESDITKIVGYRIAVVDERGEAPSQYSLQYVRALSKSLEGAFAKLAAQPDSNRKFYIQLNMLIMAAEMESVEMAQFGLNNINNPNAAMQYWAIKTIASPGIAKELSSPVTGDEDLKARIMSALQAAVRKGLYSSSLSQVVSFANAFEDKSAYDLLCRIAEQRMSAYESWSVDYELLDASILKALAKKTLLANNVTQKTACAKSFAQLYSYVIQRFILGQDVLSEDSKLQLTSVIADVEQETIGPEKFLDMNQQSMKQALIKKDLDDLQNEHNKLLGSENRSGRLASDMKFDYGQGSMGDPVTAPKKLPNPPVLD